MHNSRSGVAISTFAKPFIAAVNPGTQFSLRIVFILQLFFANRSDADAGNWAPAEVCCLLLRPLATAPAVAEICGLLLLLAGSQKHNSDSCKMVVSTAFNRLAPKTKNLVVAGGLSGFVFGVYFYTMRAVGGTDELQIAIDKFEQEKQNKDTKASLASNT
nr:cytochrome oxidase assembly protein [Ipomoea batatas]